MNRAELSEHAPSISTQRAKIFAFVEEHGRITNRDLIAMGAGASGRNRLTEQEGKDHFAGIGKQIRYVGGPAYLDHAWILEDAVDKTSQPVACAVCGRPFVPDHPQAVCNSRACQSRAAGKNVHAAQLALL